MSKIKGIIMVTMVVLLVNSLAIPVMANDDDDGNGGEEGIQGNIICDYDEDAEGGPWVATNIGDLISIVTQLIVTLAGLIAVVGGAGFTLASAARPGKSEYVKNRNNAVMYGGGAIVVLYGANALISQLSEDLNFECILPFL